MNKKEKVTAFTLMEIMVVCVIVAILATIGYPIYQNVIEDSKTRVCGSNLKALNAAVESYVREKNTVPATISSIPPRIIEREYARLFKGREGLPLRIAYFIISGPSLRQAYAEDISHGNKNIISCPSDPTSPAKVSGGISYGLNQAIVGISVSEYKALAADKVMIADNEADTFTETDLSNLTHRHKHYVLLSHIDIANVVKKDSQITTDKTDVGGHSSESTSYHGPRGCGN